MDVFVYGTLTAPEQVAEVVDAYAFVGAARLEGLDVIEGRYPTLIPGGTTGGRLLRTDDVAALDAYERVGDGLYTRVAVPLVVEPGVAADAGGAAGADAEGVEATIEDGNRSNRNPAAYPDEAAVYVGDPDRLDAEASWPGEGSFAERVRSYVAANDVRVVVEGHRTNRDR